MTSSETRGMDYPQTSAGTIPVAAPALDAAPRAFQLIAYSAPGEPGQAGPGLKASGGQAQGIDAQRREEEKLRTGLLYEEIERRGFAAGEAAARARDGAARRSEEQSLRLAVAALERTAREMLARIETEVVALSLEMARRVLDHEAQIDPLLLAGAVRSVLARLYPDASAVLVVPAGELARWQIYLAQMPDVAVRMKIEGDAALPSGSCLCRCGASSLDLSVAAQMDEISRKFKAVLAAGQPTAASPTANSPAPRSPEKESSGAAQAVETSNG